VETVAEAIHYLSLAELSRRIGARELSPVDATRHELERIEALDPRLHAYMTVTAERALERARTAETEIGRGAYRGPLHGVPLAVKDLCDTAGVRTTAGTRVMAERVPVRDATVVARLEQAGAVILGKLALTEGAYAEHHPDYPVPVNPWNAAAWSGVSSSGSAVATAAGLCFASLGSDTGGSIRFPSAMNGLVGIKPTYGRVSRHGVFPLAASLDHVGPLARTVADAAHVLGVIAGHDPADPTSLDASVPDYASEVGRSVAGIRIGIDAAFNASDVDGEVSTAVERAVDVLAGLGAEVRGMEMPAVDELVMRWSIVCGAEMLVAHESLYPARAADYGPSTRFFLEAARATPAEEYARTHVKRLELAGALAAVLREVDVVLCPGAAWIPPAVFSVLELEALRTFSSMMRFTAPFDFTGSPTVSVPCGSTTAGVPIGLQLVGRHLEEGLLVRVAAAYEDATDWHLRHPPLEA
jgi:amidase